MCILYESSSKIESVLCIDSELDKLRDLLVLIMFCEVALSTSIY